MAETETGSPTKFVEKPPRTVFETLTGMFVEDTDEAFWIAVAEPPWMVVV
jgi:hypothetical protein